MKRDSYIANAPRKRWVGEAVAVITISKVRVVGLSEALAKCEESLKLQGERFGYTPELTNLMVENNSHQIVFKADYYTFK